MSARKYKPESRTWNQHLRIGLNENTWILVALRSFDEVIKLDNEDNIKQILQKTSLKKLFASAYAG